MSMSNPINKGFATSDAGDLGPTCSVQLMFAKLQLEQSSICKAKAADYMDKIKGIQSLQKEVAAYISDARRLKDELDKSSKKGDTRAIPDNMADFLKAHGLTAGSLDKNGWQVTLTSLTNFQETVGNETQTHMVYLQDFIGQYNSFLQGANSAIAAANQVMTTVARGQ